MLLFVIFCNMLYPKLNFIVYHVNVAVATITNVAKAAIDGLTVKNFDLTRFRLYVPTLIISLILLWLPALFFVLAMRIIKFKRFSRVSKLVS